MKRIFWLLAISALVLGACKKDKNKGDAPLVVTPYDLVGSWLCTDYIDPEGEHQPDAASLESLLFSIKDLTFYAPYFDDGKYTFDNFKVDGNKLILAEGSEMEMIFHVKALDGKHLSWIQYVDDKDFIQESYINVSRILPGKWTVNYPDGSTTATIDAKGSFVEEYSTDPPQVLNCEWLLSHKDNKLSILVWEVDRDADLWETEYTILSMTDDRIETKQSKTDANVVFVRQ